MGPCACIAGAHRQAGMPLCSCPAGPSDPAGFSLRLLMPGTAENGSVSQPWNSPKRHDEHRDL